MKVLAVEDEVILLKQLTNRIREALPEAEILSFDNSDEALATLYLSRGTPIMPCRPLSSGPATI